MYIKRLAQKLLSRKFLTHDNGRSPDLRLVTNLPNNKLPVVKE